MLLLRDDDVRQVLTMPMTIEALDETQMEIAKGDAATMGRIDVYLPSTPTSFYRWAVMTTSRESASECVLCSPWIFKLCRRPARGKGNHSEAARAPGDPSASQPRQCYQRQGEGTDRRQADVVVFEPGRDGSPVRRSLYGGLS